MSLFATLFNYTIFDFDALTPRQAYFMLLSKNKRDENERLFELHQRRITNYFIVKSSFGDTKSINKPEDLYELPDDKPKYKPVTLAPDDYAFLTNHILSK